MALYHSSLGLLFELFPFIQILHHWRWLCTCWFAPTTCFPFLVDLVPHVDVDTSSRQVFNEQTIGLGEIDLIGTPGSTCRPGCDQNQSLKSHQDETTVVFPLAPHHSQTETFQRAWGLCDVDRTASRTRRFGGY